MKNLFNISGDDIACLSDSDLRELIGLLCEADCKAYGLSPSGVTWGGHQDAKDGGLDVVVENKELIPGGFIPRLKNGFQVKKPDMTASAIIAEMKPNGILRESIKALIQTGGSYIIICSTGSTADRALQDRRRAMQMAVIDEIGHENIHLDFYDRGRIATWVRTHPSMVVWVRNKVGRNLKGWQPYENWTQPGEVIDDYLIDEGMRLFDGTNKIEESELSVETGLNKIRTILSSPGSCVRLVGLSGVGKTRFVQALFDEKIGKAVLNSAQVLYADISNGPEPDPRTFAEQLISQKAQAVLICDNCPPDLHGRLANVCSGSKSTISLITVEYDVREDLPEETRVFRLEPASEELIFKLIKKRYTHISEVDARSISNFSGGNARIAIVLANTVRQGETLSGFNNEELFNRLFHQRNQFSIDLKNSAEVLSLVYSFEGTQVDSSSELSLLASLIQKSPDELYRYITELKNRDLVQKRSHWRAVLPQAIANRLAKNALAAIPRSTIIATFINSGSERLLKSFTRRLSFLHDSDDAVSIVDEWLEAGGWLGNLEGLNEFGISILKNIAPVSPKKILDAIERAMKGIDFKTRSISHHSRFVRLLRSLAYDKEFFIRSTKIICVLALAEKTDERYNNTKDVLKSLFFLMLSGTHAPVEVRYSIIDELINDHNIKKKELGLLLLATILKTQSFNSIYEFEFGAHPRDYGYLPKTQEEITHWYSSVIDKCVKIILSNDPLSNEIKQILANNFRGLWTKAGMHNELYDATLKITNMGPWNEVWLEVRTIMYFDKENINAELLKLNEILEPQDLVERIRTYALSKRGIYIEFLEHEENSSTSTWSERAEEISYNLAQQLAEDETSLNILLPELLAGSGIRLWAIGRGLAKGSNDNLALWKKLRDFIETIEKGKINILALLGFLNETNRNNIQQSNIILDEIVTDPILMEWFPDFQTSVKIDDDGIVRLHMALDNNISPIHLYKSLDSWRTYQTISDEEIANLVIKILSKEGGDDVALSILQAWFHRSGEEHYSDVLAEVGRTVLTCYRYSEENDGRFMNHYLSDVAKACLNGESASEKARLICQKILNSITSYKINIGDCDEFLETIAELQPKVFLDIIIGSNSLEDYQLRSISFDNFPGTKNPLSKIPNSVIISWCEIDPSCRYEEIIYLIETFFYSQETSKLEWTPLTITILEKAINIKKVLHALADSITPSSWSSSLADILELRLILFENLFNHTNIEVWTWAKEMHAKWQSNIIEQREYEYASDRRQSESFE
ncbi:hypothetical protein IC229_29845 [Spirosoma sp. BT702]|uniref:Uncharacterized protein n=1 Tax=Spirosoma profusum TaxID=2771354 RepID=A0A927G9Q8_9BACT|nr:hypothetical protein [Spirosoma profusum]MBD2704872.1 hypothetical protein [Spirosoma profusum]